MASELLVQGPLFGSPATTSPSPESSPEKEEANRVELALVMIGLKEGSPGFTCKMIAEGSRPCRKSQETRNKCSRRLERVDQEMIDCFMARQPARPVLPRFSSRPKLDQFELSAIQAVQDLRDFEWDILTQFSTQGYAWAWLCDCDDEEVVL